MIPASRKLIALGASALLAFHSSHAATFTWGNATANWSSAAAWIGGTAPSQGDFSELVFGGAVAPSLSPPAYTATNDLTGVFALNRLTLNATDPLSGGVAGVAHVVTGNAIRLGGTLPQVGQDGTGAIAFSTPVVLGGNLIFTGEGTGVVTFNRGFSGFADLTKTGASVFRFGTLPVAPALVAPSENSWIGRLTLNGGIVRFNNNAESGRTAMRANPVTFPASATGTPTLTCTNELRLGTLSGTVGKVESAVAGTNTDSEDIVLTVLDSGSFGGTLHLAPPTGTGNDLGSVVVRGPGVQTMTGTLQVDKDIELAASLVLAGTAALGTQTKGAINFAGGTLRLDNTVTNNTDRLRNGSTTTTGVDIAGGGLFILDGNTAGSSETISRLQLGAQTGAAAPFKTKPRSGELRLNVVHRAAAAASTNLSIQTYERDASSLQPLDTVEFSATNATGANLTLGTAGNNPHINIVTLPIASNSLLDNSTGTASTGWAVVKTPTGLAFAAHGASGILAATTVTTWATSTTANVLATASQTIGATAFELHSLRLLPSAAGQTITVAAGGSFAVKGIALAGATDFSITGAGTLSGTTPRYLHIEQATLTLGIGVGDTAEIVKAGAGILILTSTTNPTSTKTFAINRGIVRSSLATLPGGELRFRGGVLEITGGGTFSRPLLTGAAGLEISGTGTVNWNTVELTGTTPAPAKVIDDRGSGGFAAIGADLTVDLDAAGPTPILWKQKGFLQSGYALVLGSPNATARVTLVDHLSLTSSDTTVDYNAREIRVEDNPATTTDRGILSGILSGSLYNDLLKTGTGTLELSATNTLAGLTIVQAGTLVVSGSTGGIGTLVKSGATLAGTGSVGHMLLESGALLSPGDTTLATLTAASLTWKAGGIARFDLGAAAAADKIALGTGALTKSGTGTFAFNFAATGIAGQTYTLATFGSTTFTPADFTATNSAVPGTFFLVSGSLIFDTRTLTPVEQWRMSYFGTSLNTGNAADNADADADGLSNLHEYALGTTPLATTTNLPTTTRVANHLTLTFPRNPGATDITLLVEARNDLLIGTWSPIATSSSPATWTPVAPATASETAGTATITDGTDMTLIPQRFLRLKITRP